MGKCVQIILPWDCDVGEFTSVIILCTMLMLWFEFFQTIHYHNPRETEIKIKLWRKRLLLFVMVDTIIISVLSFVSRYM